MGNRLLNLYVNDEDVEIAKRKGINMSSLFREILSNELQIKELSDATTKEELINKLKSKLALCSDELKQSNRDNEILHKKIKELNKELHNKKTSEEGVEYDDDEVYGSYIK